MTETAKAILDAHYYGVVPMLKELINQLQYQSFHHSQDYYVLDVDDILELCEELETL